MAVESEVRDIVGKPAARAAVAGCPRAFFNKSAEFAGRGSAKPLESLGVGCCIFI